MTTGGSDAGEIIGEVLVDSDGARLERIPRLEEARGWLDLLRVAPIVLAFALYGLVRIATETFYDELGTTPEEVGLSYLTIVTRAAIGVASVAVILGGYVVLMVTLFRAPTNRPAPGAQGEGKGPSQRSVGVMTVISAVGFLLWYALEGPFWMALFALLPFAVAASNNWWRRPRNRWMPAVAAVTALLALAGLAFTGWSAGKWKADEVIEGHEVTTDPSSAWSSQAPGV